MNNSYRPRFTNVMQALSMVCISVVFFLSQFTLKAHNVRLIPGSLLQRNLERLPGSFGAKRNYWLSKNMRRLQWEDIHCTQDKNGTSDTVLKQWIAKLSKALGIMDGHSLFDANTGCLRWLKQFRSQFPNLGLAGFDEDDDAVDYAKRFFDDTTRRFVKRLSQARNESFHHAINFAGLQTMRSDIQCSKVKAILRPLKPGGNLYIGHNLERNCGTATCEKCLVDMESIRFIILNKCFWPKTCLSDERATYNIYYVSEQKLFDSVKDFSECQTGVIIQHSKTVGGKRPTNKTLPVLTPSDVYLHC